MKAIKFYTALLILLVFQIGYTQSYYVSNAGNDSNIGTLNNPFKTIKHADSVAVAGDTVYIMGGTYNEHSIFQINSGIAGAPIIFKNYNNGLVEIDGDSTETPMGGAIWTIQNANYITIEGVTFKNAINNSVNGLIIRDSCSHIKIHKCKFTGIHFSTDPFLIPTLNTHTANPLQAYAQSPTNGVTNITFSENEVYNCRTGRSESMTLNGNVDTFAITENYIHDVTNIGIDIAGHWGVCPIPALDQARNGVVSRNIVHNCVTPPGVDDAAQIYVDGGKNVIIENNESYNGTIGIAVNSENVGTAENITVRNNVVYNNFYTGIQMGGDSANKKVTNSSLLGNTCFKNDLGGFHAGELNIKYCDSLVVKNNILCADNAVKCIFNYYSVNGNGNTFDYNFFWTPTGANNCFFNNFPQPGYYSFSFYTAGTGQDLNSHFLYPDFVDTSVKNFHLLNSSQAINAGDPGYVAGLNETDMDNNLRVQGNVIDCGADETNVPLLLEQVVMNSVNIYPNPTNGQCIIEIPHFKNYFKLEIYNIYGHSIYSKKVITKNTAIDLSSYSDGVYFIKIGENFISQKISKNSF